MTGMPFDDPRGRGGSVRNQAAVDVYVSADVESDGPIPGPYSMLSFALVEIGTFDGQRLSRPATPRTFYRELAPISTRFEPEALAVSGLDRDRLLREGGAPLAVMDEARAFVAQLASQGTPVLVAYPLSFDWTFLYWYFVNFGGHCPFSHSRGFDLKTAVAVKGRRTVSRSGRNQLPAALRSPLAHTHHALDDAKEQADIFARVFTWDGRDDE